MHRRVTVSVCLSVCLLPLYITYFLSELARYLKDSDSWILRKALYSKVIIDFNQRGHINYEVLFAFYLCPNDDTEMATFECTVLLAT